MPTTALIAWHAWKFAPCTPSTRTQTFLPNTQKTSSSTSSRRTNLKTPARLQSQSAKMLCPLRTTAKKPWGIKRIRKAGTQEKIIATDFHGSFGARRARLKQQQSAKIGTEIICG